MEISFVFAQPWPCTGCLRINASKQIALGLRALSNDKTSRIFKCKRFYSNQFLNQVNFVPRFAVFTSDLI
jgi:hypothetical protein